MKDYERLLMQKMNAKAISTILVKCNKLIKFDMKYFIGVLSFDHNLMDFNMFIHEIGSTDDLCKIRKSLLDIAINNYILIDTLVFDTNDVINKLMEKYTTNLLLECIKRYVREKVNIYFNDSKSHINIKELRKLSFKNKITSLKIEVIRGKERDKYVKFFR